MEPWARDSTEPWQGQGIPGKAECEPPGPLGAAFHCMALGKLLCLPQLQGPVVMTIHRGQVRHQEEGWVLDPWR